MAIGRLFHLIHMTDDSAALQAWYADVFDAREFMPHNYSPFEKRDAALLVIGDSVVEPLAPAFREPGWDTMPLGRFYQRFGRHWHSIAWYTDDAGELWQRCADAGVRVLVGGGVRAEERPAADAIIMTHPKDTVTQLQFVGPSTTLSAMDPRQQPNWDDAWWVANHPLGTPGIAYTTVLTRDLARAEEVYAGVLGGTVLQRSTSALTGTRDCFVRLGDTVVQLSTPHTEGTLAAADLAANNEIHHATAFRVRDLADAERYLAGKGVTVLARDSHTLLTDPATTHGVPFRWTVWDVPGGPRDGS